MLDDRSKIRKSNHQASENINPINNNQCYYQNIIGFKVWEAPSEIFRTANNVVDGMNSSAINEEELQAVRARFRNRVEMMRKTCDSRTITGTVYKRPVLVEVSEHKRDIGLCSEASVESLLGFRA